MRSNNLWFNKKRGQDIWFNQMGAPGGGNIGVPNQPIGVPSGGLTATTTNPNLNPQNLTAGNVPGTYSGGPCNCSYSMNCWDGNNPSTLTNYPNQTSQNCPAGTTLTEPNNNITTWSGTCYDSACPGLGNSYASLPTNACPPGTQLTPPTCNPNTCYTGQCQGSSPVTVQGWNGNCPPGSSFNVPYCNVSKN